LSGTSFTAFTSIISHSYTLREFHAITLLENEVVCSPYLK
jgi:hypothetical protein